ncbi:MAG TPA: hypothetical protein VEA69_20965 [Tepidisphaeraceae bacterium]|nr:hypothetical protein [Tepidisphaeraceae bacterium]
MKHAILPLLLLVPTLLLAGAPAGTYTEDFEKMAEGKPAESILVLSGEFAVKKEGGNAFIELAADPLDTQGFMAGPDAFVTGTVSARIQAASTGKRFPEFGVGAGGPAGYKLTLMPAAKQLMVVKNEQVLAKAPCDWQSGAWTRFKLTITKLDGGKAKIEGKAWADGKDEPAAAQVAYEAAEMPNAGRPTFWSTPYSGQATRFDDLSAAVTK